MKIVKVIFFQNVVRLAKLLLGVLWLSSAAFAVEKSPVAKEQRNSTSTLSSASQAAAAAAAAAEAAANAAASAAKAANAAINAINTLLPPSQRSVIKQAEEMVPSNIATVPTQDLPIQPLNTLPLVTERAKNTHDLSMPLERNLYGLSGMMEIPVSTDSKGDFAAGLAKVEGSVDKPSEVSAMDLNDALSMALGFSRDIMIAQYREEQAAAQAGQARAILLPSLQVYMRTGRETSLPGVQIDQNTGNAVTSDRHSRTDRSLTLKQPLFDMSGFYDWRRRKVVEEARAQSKRGSRGDAYISTVNAYLNLASTKLLSTMAGEYEAQIGDLYTYVDKRAKAGAASNSDKERVKARVLGIHSSKVEQDGAHAAAGVEFARVVNATPTSLKLPTVEEVALVNIPETLQEAMALALSSNPDIGALQKELDAGDLDKRSAIGRYLPKIDLEMSTSGVMHAQGSDYTQRDERVMLVMNWLAFNGGGDMKYQEEKVARRNELFYRLDDQRRKVLQNLSAQYATLEAVRSRLDQGYQELASISSAATSMSKRMLSGNQSLLDLLDVYDRHYQAKVRLVNLHVQEMTAVSQIARLVQGDPSDVLYQSELKSNQ